MTGPSVLLPDPPANLPEAPRAFYLGLRELLVDLRPADIDAAAVEVDFGDAGVAVTLPHARVPEWTLAAQVSRRAAVVFAGPASEHFDERGADWTGAAVAYVGEVLRGEREVEVRGGFPGRRKIERLRIDFGAYRG